MILHQNTLVSELLLEEKFSCDLNACKGGCCVRGDAGAPLEKEELEILGKIWPEVRPYLSERSISAIKEQGFYVADADAGHATPLIENRECAYTVFENGIARCGIEKAWSEGKTSFRKPLSCHLYPVRLKNIGEFTAVNYEQWEICKPACSLGKKLKIPVYQFVKAALIRKFGEKWFSELEEIHHEMKE